MTDTYPTSVRLPSELKEALQRRADANTRSLNNYIIWALQEHVAATPEPEPRKPGKQRKS